MDHRAPRIPDPGAGPAGKNPKQARGRLSHPGSLITADRYKFALVDLALKALPALIIGGFSSIPGAIVGGLIIGVTEKTLEVYVGPSFGGGIEGWAPYVLAIFFLLWRPEGLFGEKIIRRV